MKRIFFATFALGLFSQVMFAQNFDKAKLDCYFDTLETHNRFFGNVAVSRNGAILYTRSVGFSDVENSLKANEHSKYRIGSISKTFTSVLVLKAVEEKRIDLDQPIDRFFPAVPNAEQITIKQLMTHRSGIHNFTDDPDYLTWHTQPRTEAEMVEIIAQKGSDFEPGSKAQYSNSNFVLLTYILEKTFHKPYPELLKEYITGPLGLKNTFFGGKINPNNNECKSYSFSGDWKLQPETDMSVPLGAGSIVSTPGDLVQFSDALFGGQLLKDESLKMMRTIKENYGMGLIFTSFYDKAGYGHTGGIDGFASVFSHFPEENVSYALTSNGTNFNTNDISIAVLSAVFNKPYDIPVFTFTTFHVSSEDLDPYLGVYSSTQIPLKITITKEDSTLIAQATGQPSFPLEPTEKDKFRFDRAGVVMEFNPKEKTMILKQSGQEFIYTKE